VTPAAPHGLGLADSERENALLVGIIEAISAGPQLGPLASRVARLIVDATATDVCFVYMLDDSGGSLTLTGAGTHTITANYGGASGSFLSSSNTTTVTVNSAVLATQAVASKSLTLNNAATSFTPVTGANGTGTLRYSVSPTLPTGLSISSTAGKSWMW